jgi:hypothetical protein
MRPLVLDLAKTALSHFALARLEAQAEVHLREALFIMAGRLEQAARAPAKTPIPRGGTQ